MPGTYLDRLWDMHVVASLAGGVDLLHVDRHILHDVTSPQAFSGLKMAGRRTRNPELAFGSVDHIVATEPGRGDDTVPGGRALIQAFRNRTREEGIRLFDVGDPDRGIIHVVSPEQGIALPGLLLICADSHTCTIGALGALAWGIGTSEAEHVLATQTIRARRPKTMRVRFEGALAPGVSAKDMALHLIRTVGVRGGKGHAIEFDGAVVGALSVEARMTLCNMAVEAGSAIAVIRPDDSVFEYLKGRPYAPVGTMWDQAVAHWRELASTPAGTFDRDVLLDAAAVAPSVTWGTSPQQVIAIDEPIPDPRAIADPVERRQAERALEYMGLAPGRPLAGVAIDRVFIGSCTNARLSDLRAAAAVAKGRRVPAHVRAIVVPGSGRVKRDAEREGLDRVFVEAGFEWREPGCSMCAGVNPDRVGPRERCVATSNRNFEGRQGHLARTHLASPAMAAAAAAAGAIADVRRMP